MARTGKLVTLGIEVREPSTGYGYIQRGETLGRYGDFAAYSVARFFEKPNRERAEAFQRSGEHYWNAGIFIWHVEAIVQELALYQPKMLSQLAQIDLAYDTPAVEQALYAVWPAIDNSAIDVAVMERAKFARAM